MRNVAQERLANRQRPASGRFAKLRYHSRRQASLLVALTLLATATGCGETEPTLSEVVRQCARLERTRASTDADLRDELRRIEDAGGLPLQQKVSPPAEKKNVATALAPVFDPKLLRGILDHGRQLFPKNQFTFSPIRLQRAADFRDKYQQKIDQVYAALDRPRCDFGVDFELGYFYEAVFLEEAEAAFHLLACEAAQHLAADRPRAALRPLAAMLSLARHLGDAPSLVARSKAAQLRAEALLLVEAIAQHPGVASGDLAEIYRILHGQLLVWPPDRRALVADRAMSLHGYEAIRRGLLRWMLTSSEQDEFREQGISRQLGKALAETIDQDELFYLRTMRRYIASSELPYHERTTQFEDVEQQLNAMETLEDYPFAAARLFLPGIRVSQRAAARDRARCEAWVLALANALELVSPPLEVNPFTGARYRIIREEDRVIVNLGDVDERDPIVPLKPSTEVGG